MTTKRILFASEYAGLIGGIERYIFDAAKALKRRGHEVYGVFAKDAPHKEEFLSAFDKTWKFSEFSSTAERFDLVTVHKISDPKNFELLRRKFKITLFVHAHEYYCPKGYKYFPKGRVNCTRPYSKLFCGSCASIVPPRQITDVGMFARNFFTAPRLFSEFKRCDSYVVLSNFMGGILEENGIQLGSINVIPPMIKLPPAPAEGSARHGKTPSIVFAGQQVMSKGTPLFLEACKNIRGNFEANILGDGFRLDYFKSLAEKMGLAEKVHFRGWVSDVGEWLSKADVFAFPSLWQEPFGLSGCEAMSYGVPVVGFDTGAVREWLHPDCGRLVPPRNFYAMARELSLLISNETLRNTLGENARKFVAKNFSESRFVNNIEKLI